MGKTAYKKVKSCTKTSGEDIYPSYDVIQQSKLECYPRRDAMRITDSSGEIELQALLNLTTKRLFIVLEKVIETLEDVLGFTMDHKSGMDVSSDHAQFKKKSDENFCDSSMFLITLVPLRLVAVTQQKDSDQQKEVIVWTNGRPNSTRLSRPIKFTFEKESLALVQRETESLNAQIQNLQPTPVSNGKTVEHKISMTMIDGKICNFLTGTKSSQVCNICDISPSKMNIWEETQKYKPKVDNYKY